MNSNTKNVPHDLVAEESVLGAMMLAPAVIDKVLAIVGPADFYKPAHGTVFHAIHRLWESGTAVDAVTVANYLEVNGGLKAIGGHLALAQIVSSTPATSNAEDYARVVVDHALRRRIATLSFDLYNKALDLMSPADLLDLALESLGTIDLSSLNRIPEGLWSVDDFLARPKSSRARWVIPGMLRAGWRVVLVAEEGVGKSLFVQQICSAAAQGVHPFGLHKIVPIRTLFIDFENPEERVDDGFQMVQKNLTSRADYEAHRSWLWHRPAGIEVRNRTERAQLEAVIAATKPDLVCIGPVYKMYTPHRGDSDESVAREIHQVLDDLRTRYSFAIILEHHAPKGTQEARAMVPYGSSYWLRWPEFGIGIVRDVGKNNGDEDRWFKVGRWRRDRMPHEAAWPDFIERAGDNAMFPWSGSWVDDRWHYFKPDSADLNEAPPTDAPPHTDDDYNPF